MVKSNNKTTDKPTIDNNIEIITNSRKKILNDDKKNVKVNSDNKTTNSSDNFPYITKITSKSDDLVQHPITVDFSNNCELKEKLKKKFKKNITDEMLEKEKDTKNFAPRLSYFLSQGKFFTKNFISIIIPKWICNVFELNIFITYIHKHNLLLPLLVKSGRINELPVFGTANNEKVIFANTNSYLSYDFQQYLKNNKLRGKISHTIV